MSHQEITAQPHPVSLLRLSARDKDWLMQRALEEEVSVSELVRRTVDEMAPRTALADMVEPDDANTLRVTIRVPPEYLTRWRQYHGPLALSTWATALIMVWMRAERGEPAKSAEVSDTASGSDFANNVALPT